MIILLKCFFNNNLSDCFAALLALNKAIDKFEHFIRRPKVSWQLVFRYFCHYIGADSNKFLILDWFRSTWWRFLLSWLLWWLQQRLLSELRRMLRSFCGVELLLLLCILGLTGFGMGFDCALFELSFLIWPVNIFWSENINCMKNCW